LSEVSGTAPADPSSSPTPSYRVMRTVVIGLGIVMVVMFGLVIAKLFSAMQGHETSETPGQPTVFTLAPGARIVSTDVQNDRLILHIRNPSGDEIDIIDTESGRLVGQVKTALPTR
jgi:hypothetical protein